MKKIVLWILSLLLIAPVFAENINWISYENSISLESLTQWINTTYIELPYDFSINWSQKSSYFWFFYNRWFWFLSSFWISSFTWFSDSIDLNNSMFIQSWNLYLDITWNVFWFPLLAVQKSWVLYDFSKFHLFFSRFSESEYSWFNPLYSFGTKHIDWVYDILNQSYVRLFQV